MKHIDNVDFRNSDNLQGAKLQKILFFASMISFAKYGKPLFLDSGDFMVGKVNQIQDSIEDEYLVLDMAFDIFGNLSEKELSMLLAEFDAYSLAKKGEPSENDITRIRAMIDAFENEKESVYRKEIINGSKFYIHRECFSGDLIDKLEEFSKTCTEDSYTVCMDNGTLIIY